MGSTHRMVAKQNLMVCAGYEMSYEIFKATTPSVKKIDQRANSPFVEKKGCLMAATLPYIL